MSECTTNSVSIKIMPNILSRKVTKILLARFARSLKVYRRASHKSRNFAISIILFSEKRENSEMILRERGGGGRGEVINCVIRYVWFMADKTIHGAADEKFIVRRSPASPPTP